MFQYFKSFYYIMQYSERCYGGRTSKAGGLFPLYGYLVN